MPALVRNIWIFYKRVKLFSLIVYRYDQSDTRMKPKLAWTVAKIIWD